MKGKRVTIYDLAAALGISASYVSRALNDHPSISDKIKKLVKAKAHELNYKHNLHAANLRRGSSKTIGVIVPKINENFFSQVIAGMEEVCFANNYSLIICQSEESFQKEKIAIDTLIGKNVDCILISVSLETKTALHLQEIAKHNIHLIQFDRCLDELDSCKVVNDNRAVALQATQHLIAQGYNSIAYLGGPDHIPVYRDRREGFLQALKTAGISIPYHFVIENALSKEAGARAAAELLQQQNPPQAFFTASDYAALGVLQVARSMGISVPGQLGIMGFANEEFTELIQPALSSVNQEGKELGKQAASLYFSEILQKEANEKPGARIIPSKIMIRQSTLKAMS